MSIISYLHIAIVSYLFPCQYEVANFFRGEGEQGISLIVAPSNKSLQKNTMSKQVLNLSRKK
jgi:hypothetical protein